jgi:membrane associated rhomboid family serine protease
MPAEMQSQTGPWAVVVTAADERRCAELALVLTARGIEHQKLNAGDGWKLLVAAANAERAMVEIAAYRVENARAIGQRHLEEVGNGWPGIVAYAVILLTVFLCVRQSVFGLDWYGAGRLQAGRVVAGEWWRAATALTVHLDLDHLAGNLGFGGFFGYFVGRYLGPGVGWLAILGAATLGNVLNALAQSPQHRSIGASTAVFAALGLLTAYTWRRGFLKETPWRARIAPIIAGLGLLAFTGTAGENTDLFAHLTGFVAGFGSGLLLARFARVEITRLAGVQNTCAAVTLLAVVAAWVWGLWSVG